MRYELATKPSMTLWISGEEFAGRILTTIPKLGFIVCSDDITAKEVRLSYRHPARFLFDDTVLVL